MKICLILFLIIFKLGFSQKDQFVLGMPLGHNAQINSLNFSHDNRFVISASDDQRIILWEGPTFKYLRENKFHNDNVFYSTFSLDNKLCLSVSRDRFIIIRDFQTDTIINKIQHPFIPKEAKFIKNSAQIVSYGYGNSVFVWDTFTGHLIFKLAHHSNDDSHYIKNISISPDESFVISTSSDGTSKIWDLKTGTFNFNLNTTNSNIDIAKYSPNGKYIFTCYQNGLCKLLNTENGQEKLELIGDNGNINYGEFSHDNQFLITCSDNQTVKVWNVSNGELIYNIICRDEVDFVQFNTLGNYFMIKHRYHPTVLVYKFETGKMFSQIELDNHISYTQFLPDGKIYLSSANGESKIWDFHSNEIKDLGNAFKTFKSVAFENNKVIINFWDNSSYNYGVTEDQLTSSKNKKNNVIKINNNEEESKFLNNHEKLINIIDIAINEDLISNDNNNLIRKTLQSDDQITKGWKKLNEDLINLTEFYLADELKAGISPNGKYLVTKSSAFHALLWDIENEKIIAKLNHNHFVSCASFSKNSEMLATGSADNSINLWDKNGHKISTLNGHREAIVGIAFSDDYTKLFSHSKDGAIIAWDLESKCELFKILFVKNDNDPITILPSGYYMGNNNNTANLYYIHDLKTISFTQLDVKYNRPDKVLKIVGETFGKIDTLLINSYHNAWQKRLKRLNIDANKFEEELSVVTCDFKNRHEIDYEQINEKLSLQIWGKDIFYKLDRYNVWVNDVPVFGQNGINIRNEKSNEVNKTVTIKLSEGINKIETSVLNENGVESYRIPLYVKFTPSKNIPQKVYFVGIGVDKHIENKNDLKYAVKDIRDLAKNLKLIHGDNLSIDTIFNKQVTIKNIKLLKNKLLNSDVNDKVIVSFSGHGVFDDNYDYYLATHEMNFKKPSKNGLPYNDLEWLLDGIPARKKLLLLDACHSGEVDKDELITLNNNKPEDTKGSIVVHGYKPKVGLKNSFELMQELFASVKRGTGATIISAAGGTQFAYEKGNLQNGVFTFSILELMLEKKNIKLSDLKVLVGHRVLELTNGLQRPTSRNEILEFDWHVW